MARPQAPVGAPKQAPGSDDQRERLVALRDLLARRIVTAGNRDLAPLAARYQAVLAELSALPTPVEVGDVVDDLTARRARGAAAGRPKRPATG